ncbi:MAG: phospholipase A [Thiobacillus sp.]|nr:phospholipase A [Thiobacillus sp.]
MKSTTPLRGSIPLALLCAGLLGHAQAASMADWEGCSSIPADADRLTCYDRVSGHSQPEAVPVPPAAAGAKVQPAPQPVVAQAAPPDPKLLSALSRHWELDDEAKQGAFLFRPHHANYFLPLKASNRPNNTPYQSSLIQPDQDLDPVEAELQLSFKIKAMEGVFGYDNADLWFGYTITSFWQAYNANISSPFRETEYEPEVMLVYRTDYEIAGFRGRFLNLGAVHQSNGRSEGLSRSWDRIYAQFGLERDNLALLIRPWYRIPESAGEDDNPDIIDYMGHGDLVAVYRDERNAYSLMLRKNFETGYGAVELNWSFPLYGRLKGYAQYFNGYGESLIDYNHSQQTFGIGVSLTEGM